RDADVDWIPAEARPPRKVARTEAFAENELHPPPTVASGASGITSVQTFIGGDAHAESVRRGRSSGGEKVFYVSIGWAKTGDNALRDAQATAAAASQEGLTKLTADHRAWWHGYYPASFLSFPDPRLESYYWIQIYKIGSAMRDD